MKKVLFALSFFLLALVTHSQVTKVIQVTKDIRIVRIGGVYYFQHDSTGTGQYVTHITQGQLNGVVGGKLDKGDTSNMLLPYKHWGLYPSLTGNYVNPGWIASLNINKITGISGTPNGSKFLRDDYTWAPGSSAPANIGLGTRTATTVPLTNDNGTAPTIPAVDGTNAGVATPAMYNQYLESYKSFYLRNAVSGSGYFKQLYVPNDSTGVIAGLSVVAENNKVTIDTTQSTDSTKKVVIGVNEANFSGIPQSAVTGLTAALAAKLAPGDLKTVNGQSLVGSGDITVGSGSGDVTNEYLSLPPLSTPGSFSAAASSSTQIDLTWTDVSSELNYEIQRSTTPATGASWSTINSPAANAVSYNNTGLTASTQYYYRLRAIGNGGTERNSQWTFANAITDAGGVTGSTIRKEAEAFDTYNEYGTQQLYANDDADASLYVYAVRSGMLNTYGITTAAGGSHSFTFRVNSGSGGSQLLVKDNSGTLLSTVTIPFTGGGWQDVTTSITLASGTQTLKFEKGTGTDFMINYFDVDNSLQSPTTRMALITAGNAVDFMGWAGVTKWNSIGTTQATLVAGTYSNTTLRTDHFVKWGWGIATTNAWSDYGSAPTPGTPNTGIFGEDVLIFKQWQGNDGSALKFTGLNPAKTYDVWILTSASTSQTVNFTVGGTTTANKNANGNMGDNVTYPDWQDDPAMLHVTAITPNGSGEISVVCHLVSGTMVPVTAMVIKEN